MCLCDRWPVVPKRTTGLSSANLLEVLHLCPRQRISSKEDLVDNSNISLILVILNEDLGPTIRPHTRKRRKVCTVREVTRLNFASNKVCAFPKSAIGK